MALIKCPECGKEVSDRAVACIHCGYPLNNQHITENINGKQYNVAFLYDYNMSQIEKIKKLCELTGCDLMTSKEIVLKYHPTKQRTTTTIESNIPKCPHCHSTNIKPISGTERAVSIMGLGIFSKKINKSFKCSSCGYTW